MENPEQENSEIPRFSSCKTTSKTLDLFSACNTKAPQLQFPPILSLLYMHQK
ncbi:hypothetical protein Nmel_009814 [Mimus melanotis]